MYLRQTIKEKNDNHGSIHMFNSHFNNIEHCFETL